MKKYILFLVYSYLCCCLFFGCGKSESKENDLNNNHHNSVDENIPANDKEVVNNEIMFEILEK